jgi:hypothetical protein
MSTDRYVSENTMEVLRREEFLCRECGSVVWSQHLHDKWHTDHE